MRRAHTVTFQTTYNEHIIRAYSHDGGELRFTCEALKEMHKPDWSSKAEAYERDKVYDSVAAILDAIDRYELSLRKDFVNKTAYRLVGYREDQKVEEVTVTSVSEDGRECWIKTSKGERSKDNTRDLYHSSEPLKQYVATMKWHRTKFQTESDKAEKELQKLENKWQPKKA